MDRPRQGKGRQPRMEEVAAEDKKMLIIRTSPKDIGDWMEFCIGYTNLLLPWWDNLQVRHSTDGRLLYCCSRESVEYQRERRARERAGRVL